VQFYKAFIIMHRRKKKHPTNNTIEGRVFLYEKRVNISSTRYAKKKNNNSDSHPQNSLQIVTCKKGHPKYNNVRGAVKTQPASGSTLLLQAKENRSH